MSPDAEQCGDYGHLYSRIRDVPTRRLRGVWRRPKLLTEFDEMELCGYAWNHYTDIAHDLGLCRYDVAVDCVMDQFDPRRVEAYDAGPARDAERLERYTEAAFMRDGNLPDDVRDAFHYDHPWHAWLVKCLYTYFRRQGAKNGRL
jgi:hypothetical protein